MSNCRRFLVTCLFVYAFAPLLAGYWPARSHAAAAAPPATSPTTAPSTPGAQAKAPPDPAIVATVNGTPITREAFYAGLEQAYGAQVLERMITEMVVLQAEKKYQINVTQQEVEADIERIRGNYDSEADFVTALKEYGMTPADLSRQVRMSIVIDRLATHGITVTDAELRAYFDEHKEQLGTPERFRLRHILVETRAEAESILALIRTGASFERLAQERSRDFGTRDQGGDLGFASRDNLLAPQFASVLPGLKPGQVSQPVETYFGWHLIKLVEQQPARPAVFAEVKEQIRQILISQRAKPADQVINELLRSAHISINWERYQNLFGRQTTDARTPDSVATVAPGPPGASPGK